MDKLHRLIQRSWELAKCQIPISSLLFKTKDLYLLHSFLYTVNRWSYGVVLYEIFTVGRSRGLTDFYCLFMGVVQLLRGHAQSAFISRMCTEAIIWGFNTTDILQIKCTQTVPLFQTNAENWTINQHPRTIYIVFLFLNTTEQSIKTPELIVWCCF